MSVCVCRGQRAWVTRNFPKWGSVAAVKHIRDPWALGAKAQISFGMK